MGKLDRHIIPLDLIDTETKHYNWELVRSNDGLTKYSEDVLWISFNDDGTFKSKHNSPEVGRSLLMSPFNHFFTWQTTVITKILELRPDFIRFETENSTYTLIRAK